jgi:hypothetical protein
MFDNFTTDRVRHWRLIVEEYGPKIVYIKGCTNIVPDNFSRYPRKEGTLPPSNEMFVIEEDQDEIFPLAFEVISEAQQSDNQLLHVAQANQNYSTKILLCCKIVHYKKNYCPTYSSKPHHQVVSHHLTTSGC